MTPQALQLKKSKIFSIFDVILLVVLLILCLLPLFFKPQTKGVYVKITYGEQSEIHALSQNKTLKINGAVIRIDNGKVYFESNDCSTRECVHKGKLSIEGEVAVCLPKGIFVEIVGDKFDGSTQ